MSLIPTEPAIVPASMVVEHESREPTDKLDSETKKTASVVEASGDESIGGPEAVLSDLKLFFLATGMFISWSCAAGAILQTSFILPVIAKEFGISAAEVQWVAASCMTTWGCLIIIAGRLCDIFGRKKGYLVGASIWILFNTITAFMPNLVSLNICRGFAGVGAAILGPACTGLIGALYPVGKKRTLAFVAVSAGGASGAACGELFAGLFMEYTRWTWRPCFLVNAGASLYPLALVIWLVPYDTPHTRNRRMDWLGSLFLGGSLFLLLFAFTVSQTAERGWKAPYIPGLFVGSALLLALFVWRQRRLLRAGASGRQYVTPPLVPASLLTKRCLNLYAIFVASAFSWGGIDSIITFIYYLYIDVLGMNKLEAGLKVSLTAVSGCGAALLVAVTISRVPPRALIAGCCALTTVCPILYAVRGIDWPYWKADLWAILVIALATDSTIAAGLTLITMIAPQEDGSVATALFTTSCRLGYPVGLAIATLVSTEVEHRALANQVEPRQALLDGLRGAFWVCAGFVVVAGLVVLFGMRGWMMLDGKGQHGEASTEQENQVASAERKVEV